MRCHHCGATVDEQARFCLACGSQLPARDAAAASSEPAGVGATAAGDTTTVLAATPTDEAADAPTDAAANSALDELQTCPSCSAPNSPRRYLCGRCGVDLVTGRPGADPTNGRSAVTGAGPDAAGTAPAGETPPAGRRRPSRRWLAVTVVIAAGIVVGAVLGYLVAAEIGPFAPEGAELPPPPAFDPATYDDEPAELRAATVAASSVLRQGGDRSYEPDQMVDGDLETAWNSATSAPGGRGEVLEVTFAEPVWLDQVVLANGDQSGEGEYLGNARLRRARMVLDGSERFELVFLDERGRQVIDLAEPRLTSVVRLEVLRAYDGDTYNDLAVAELGFRGWVARGEDVVVGRQRATTGTS